MNLVATFRIAINALRLNKMRSMLTMLGIIIGVGAVITMIAVGGGVRERVQNQIKSLGSNLMIILPGSTTASGVRMGSGANLNLTEDDAIAIAREVPEVQLTAPMNRAGAQVVAGGNNWATQVYGVTPDWFEARDWPLAEGRIFEQAEMQGSAKVIILGQTVAEELFGDEDPINQSVRVKNIPFTVIGVLSRKGQSMMGTDQDDTAVIPISTHRNRLFGNQQGKLRRVNVIQVKVWEGANMKDAEEHIRDLMRQRQRTQPGQDDQFTLRNLTEILQAHEASSQVMTLLLAAVASVSLLVGGIGIMNIMLVSVTERTREIGLRMAIGARAKDILTQFLVEAITLSVIGGFIGIIVGAAGSALIAHFAGWATKLSVGSIVLAVGFSAAIGIFFGFYPAHKASKLLPIEALRYE
ncbi:MAG: ABC transporter permease [Alistipes senegalensis]|nr:ABC transporter permease [Oxalobacter formigenes]MCM1281901.1 ABC transporter permease [Alistipes senegalensis]